jgi:hypothetical protein
MYLITRYSSRRFLAPDGDASGATVLDGAVDTSIPDGETFGNDLMKTAEVEAGERQVDPDDAAKAAAAKAAADKAAAAKGEIKVADPLAAALGDEKAVEKKVDPSSDPMDEFKDVTEGVKSEKVKERLTKMHTRLAAELKANADLSKELESLRTKVPLADRATELQKQLETTKAENSKLRDSITALNVDYDPAVQEKYVGGRNKILTKATDRVRDYGGDVDAFKSALNLSGKQKTAALKEALADVDEVDRPRIFSLLAQVETLDEEHAELRKDPQQAWEKLTQAHKVEIEKQQAEAATVRQAVFEKVARELPATSPFLRVIDPAIEGAADWNKAVQGAYTAAQRLLSPNATFEEVSAAAIKSADYDRVAGIALNERKLRLDAEKKVREFEGASPGPNGHRKPPAGSKAGEDDDKPFGEQLMELANAGGDEE